MLFGFVLATYIGLRNTVNKYFTHNMTHFKTLISGNFAFFTVCIFLRAIFSVFDSMYWRIVCDEAVRKGINYSLMSTWDFSIILIILYTHIQARRKEVPAKVDPVTDSLDKIEPIKQARTWEATDTKKQELLP